MGREKLENQAGETRKIDENGDGETRDEGGYGELAPEDDDDDDDGDVAKDEKEVEIIASRGGGGGCCFGLALGNVSGWVAI